MGYFSPEPLYLRNRQDVKVYLDTQDFVPAVLPIYAGWRDDLADYVSGAIGFCGIEYPYIRHEVTNEFTFDSTKVDKRLLSVFQASSHDRREHHTYLSCPIYYYENTLPIRYDELGKGRNKATRRWITVVKNPCLADLEFYRVKDSFTCFQELEMWLSNQASPEKPIPEVSNNDMIEAKGFDLKHSFRNTK